VPELLTPESRPAKNGLRGPSAVPGEPVLKVARREAVNAGDEEAPRGGADQGSEIATATADVVHDARNVAAERG
jgi:hypothetical protein